MKRRYYTDPPVRSYDVPPFIYKHYDVDEFIAHQIQKMIVWANHEYNRAVVSANRHASPQFMKILREEYSAMRVLAESEGFKELLSVLNEKNYNKLSGRERVFLRRAYEFYKALT